ncbi:MAG TPA: o-succinylbenzoate synthase, partial [Candidatus Caenarcaniphilales bacterium]
MARFEFRVYRRKLKQSLKTRHGEWHLRTGIILRLTDETAVGFGEIAPLSWFGSESFEQALTFCRQLPAEVGTDTIFSIPAKLPACQFGFESAWEALKDPDNFKFPTSDSGLMSGPLPQEVVLPYSALLPARAGALHTWKSLWSQGYRTFKWKIGTAPLLDEMKVFQDLIQVLPGGAKLRLDANGGLSWQEASEWLRVCDQCDPVGIEFLEQPLPVDQLDAMLALGQQHSTPIALDESVATLKQLQACYQQGWRAIFVIKPAIAGSPQGLRQFCQAY